MIYSTHVGWCVGYGKGWNTAAVESVACEDRFKIMKYQTLG